MQASLGWGVFFCCKQGRLSTVGLCTWEGARLHLHCTGTNQARRELSLHWLALLRVGYRIPSQAQLPASGHHHALHRLNAVTRRSHNNNRHHKNDDKRAHCRDTATVRRRRCGAKKDSMAKPCVALVQSMAACLPNSTNKQSARKAQHRRARFPNHNEQPACHSRGAERNGNSGRRHAAAGQRGADNEHHGTSKFKIPHSSSATHAVRTAFSMRILLAAPP